MTTLYEEGHDHTIYVDGCSAEREKIAERRLVALKRWLPTGHAQTCLQDPELGCSCGYTDLVALMSNKVVSE